MLGQPLPSKRVSGGDPSMVYFELLLDYKLELQGGDDCAREWPALQQPLILIEGLNN